MENKETYIEEVATFINEHSMLTWLSSVDLADDLYNAGFISKRKGKWVPKEIMIRSIDALNYTCSECGVEGKHTNYCPNCGAKMEK